MIILNRILFTIIIFSILLYIIKKIFYINKNIIIIDSILELLPTLIIIFIFRSFIYEPFQIPSASMMPTLLIGDLILVNKLLYNIKNPLNNKTIWNIKKPNYGDVIVFQYPKNKNINYIKRVIGLPGDKIIYNEFKKEIQIYTSKNKTNIVKYSFKKKSSYIEEIQYNNNKLEEYFWNTKKKNFFSKHSEIFFLTKKTEHIGNIKYNILLMSENNNLIFKKNIYSYKVPKNMYFVMGDYRDNSEDSRYWGFVHQDLIIGKAKYIWMSFEKQYNKWPTGIRFNRIGKII